MLTFAVGDVHGEHQAMVELVEMCRNAARDTPLRFVFLGDYVDYGPDSAAVIAFLRDWRRQNPQEIVMLKGNHEEVFCAAIADWPNHEPERDSVDELAFRWETYRSFVGSDLSAPAASAFLSGLPTYFDDGLRYFVHAGVDPDVGLEHQDDAARLWIRNEFLLSDVCWPRLVVHGHSPTKPVGIPQIRHNRVAIDTHACKRDIGGRLTAAVFDDQDRLPVAFLQV